MSRAEVSAYFGEFVYGFMQSDIQREVDMARRGQPAGNVLAALGLAVYTEALGRIGRKNGLLAADGATFMEQQFNGFFDLLGAGYRPWRTRFKRRTGQSVYRAFRHGFAHEYAPKVHTTVVMLGHPRVAIVTRGSTYVFVVEAYLRHFIRAAHRLERLLLALPDPKIPPAD